MQGKYRSIQKHIMSPLSIMTYAMLHLYHMYLLNNNMYIYVPKINCKVECIEDDLNKCAEHNLNYFTPNSKLSRKINITTGMYKFDTISFHT